MIGRRTVLGSLAVAPFASASGTATRVVPASSAVTVRDEEGWYMHSAGVVALGDELVGTYRRSDEHVASKAEVWCCRSKDGGRTWTDHKLLTQLGWEPDKACWVAPQLNRTSDGTLVLIIDRGEKLSRFDWPMLSEWQRKPRGMSNWLMTSRDKGRTWDGPRKIDDVGGEPSYIVELSNGSWMYTRTDSAPTTAKKFPAMPWGPNYYRSTAVFSDDKGKTWKRTVALTDDPLIGDCEVGVVEYAPGKIVAITRVGDAGSGLAQPSRWVYSEDYGRTWSKPVLGPIYAHRPYLRKLRDGRLLVTFRNGSNGTTGTCALAWKPEERLGYQPQSFLWDESRCSIDHETMTLRTGEGREHAAQFMLYPVEDDDSSVDLSFELAVHEGAPNACNVSAGAWVRFTPTRVELANRPADGFEIDAKQWHRYRILNEGRRIRIWSDGKLKLDTPVEGVFTREVRFGNRPGRLDTTLAGTYKNHQSERKPLPGIRYEYNAGVSMWRSFEAQVQNRRDHSVHWTWTPRQGFPDQFRRDRVILLEPNATFIGGDSGYSSCDALPDGTAVVLDYTGGREGRRYPMLRAYRFTP